MTKRKSQRIQKPKFAFKLDKGQTLIELAAALGVLLVIITSLVLLGLTVMRSSDFAKKQDIAVQLSNQVMEAMRVHRDSAPTRGETFQLALVAGECYTLYAEGDIEGPLATSCDEYYEYAAPFDGFYYNIKVVAEGAAPDSRKVLVTVRFVDAAGNHDTKLESYFTDWY